MADVTFDDLIPGKKPVTTGSGGQPESAAPGDVSFDDLIPKAASPAPSALQSLMQAQAGLPGMVKGVSSMANAPASFLADATTPATSLMGALNHPLTLPGYVAGHMAPNGLASRSINALDLPRELIHNATAPAAANPPIAALARSAGIIPADPNYQATTFAGRVADNVGAALPALAMTPATGGASLAPVMGAIKAAVPIVGAATGQTAAEDAFPGNPIASLFGSLAGGGISGVAANANQIAKSAIRRGTTADQVAQTMDDFATVGATPTVAQAVQKPPVPGGQPQPNFLAQGTETAVSNYPGGAGIMAKKASDLQAGIGAKVGSMADDLAPNSDPMSAGRAIKKGITEGFVPDKRATEGDLYDQVSNAIPAGQRFDATRLSDALDEIDSNIGGARNTMSSPIVGAGLPDQITQLKAALQKDSTPGLPQGSAPNMTFKSMQSIRTSIGQQLQNPELRGSPQIGALKKIYSALTEDMGNAAAQSGPDAEAAFSRAGQYSKGLNSRLDVLQDVTNSDIPEQIFRNATTNTKDGATALTATMKSLPPDQRAQVTSAVLKRMGLAKAGQQNASGDAFSMETFLTNWNGMSPQAKNALFNGVGNPELRQNIDAISRVAGNVRAGGKVFSNPSGTARQTALMSILGTSGVGGLLTGNPGATAAVGASIGGANITARLMTNPNAVRWLAKSAPQYAADAKGAALRNMVQAANASGDTEFQDIANQLSTQGMAPAQTPKAGNTQNTVVPDKSGNQSQLQLEKPTIASAKKGGYADPNLVAPAEGGDTQNPKDFNIADHIMQAEGKSGTQDGRNEIYGFRAGEGTGYDQLRRMASDKGIDSPEVRQLATTLLAGRAAKAGADRFDDGGVKAGIATVAHMRGEGGARAIMAGVAGLPLYKGLAQIPTSAVNAINSMSPEEFQQKLRDTRESYDRKFYWDQPASVTANGKTKSDSFGNLFGKGLISRYNDEQGKFLALSNS